MYVPENQELQLFLLEQHRNPASQGHPDYKAIFQKLEKNWFWIGMAKHCQHYAINCAICRHTKAYNTQKQGFLSLLPVLNRKWVDLLLDFVVQLPECRR